MAKYDEFTSLKHPGRKVQVESAKRDGNGRIIAETYMCLYLHSINLTIGEEDVDLKIISKRSTAYQSESEIRSDLLGGRIVNVLRFYPTDTTAQCLVSVNTSDNPVYVIASFSGIDDGLSINKLSGEITSINSDVLELI